ncbi:MAG: hypothetical protein IPP33_17505 [Flavobacteriales bacterium]|nr:hypothetical protein [Flavobacteriales bacterium]
MDELWIRVFRPVDDPVTAVEYLHEHQKVLEDIGVSPVLAGQNHWMEDPSVQLLVAFHTKLGMVAGIRVQPSHPERPLPMETAIIGMDSGIHDAMRFLSVRGTAEICGLWNAHRFAGKGLPNLLSLAAVSLANQLNLNTMVCFVAHYTVRHARKTGFVPLESVGMNGEFIYPIPTIRSTAMLIPDTISLASAPSVYRSSMLSLRTRPLQTRLESPSGIDLNVRYMLQLEASGSDLTVYGDIYSERFRQTA